MQRGDPESDCTKNAVSKIKELRLKEKKDALKLEIEMER
jgi:hypothetical protein